MEQFSILRLWRGRVGAGERVAGLEDEDSSGEISRGTLLRDEPHFSRTERARNGAPPSRFVVQVIGILGGKLRLGDVGHPPTSRNQQITGAYSQGDSVEILTADTTSIPGTDAPDGTILFSWLIPASGQGDYSYSCALTFDNITLNSGIGIAIQGNLNPPSDIEGRAVVDTQIITTLHNTSSTTASANSDVPLSMAAAPIITVPTNLVGARAVLGATVNGSLQVGAGGTQFNVIFFNPPSSGTGLIIKANSECGIHGK